MKRIWMIAGMTVGLALAGCSTQEEPFVSSEGERKRVAKLERVAKPKKVEKGWRVNPRSAD